MVEQLLSDAVDIWQMKDVRGNENYPFDLEIIGRAHFEQLSSMEIKTPIADGDVAVL